ncbi:hypothetical protein [Asticcacaulis sp.]|uniref:hypothetical protein n=1 Tax=Asticcacaulis sp. TaxID=1872648 RepID=UPI0026062E2B|nr:hypothetical protein [Asticcacaulis sp.]
MATSDAFPAVFQALRSLMIEAAPDMVITADTDCCLTLKTTWTEARTGEPAWFGWLALKKSYVAYHLLPLYSLPELNARVPASLEKKRQGKTCFGFKTIDPALFDDLRALTAAAAAQEEALKAAIG